MKRFLRLLTSCLDTLFRRNPPANALRDRVTQLSEEAVAINSQQLANNETNGYRFLLYLEILDYARNIEILVQHGFQSNTPVFLIRGMFEALADLRNLTVNEDALIDMKLRYFKERKKILGRAKAGNTFLAPLQDDGLDDLIASCEESINELVADGANTQTIRDRFESADLKSQYEGEYAFFSEYVHRGLKVLENQFIVGSDGSWQFPPELEKHWREPKMTPIMKTAEWILGDAREQLTLSCMI
jgi:hypothetical protein